jgi:hypothetical protein
MYIIGFIIMFLIMFLVSCLIMYVIPGLIRKPSEADPRALLMYLSRYWARSLGLHPNLRHAFGRVVDSDAILAGHLPMLSHLLRNL